MIDWLTDWLTIDWNNSLADPLTGWVIDRPQLMDQNKWKLTWLTDGSIDWSIDWLIN